MLKRLAAVLFALPALYLGAALIGAFLPNGQTGGGQGPVTVYLLATPIHYDLYLPNDPRTRAAFAFAAPEVPFDTGAAWIVAGWGSRAFYTQTGTYADLSAATVWQAATGDDAVLHVAVAGPLDGYPARALHLTEAEYTRLLAALLDPAPDPTPIPGYTAYDRFFAVPGRFSLWNTCNVWIADVLRRSGIAFGRWTPTPFAVTLSLHRFQPEP